MYAILLQQFILSVECAEEFLNEKLFKLLALACHYDAFSLFAAIYVYICCLYGGKVVWRHFDVIYIYEFTSFTVRHIRINTHSTHSASQAKHNSARRMNAKEICFARYTIYTTRVAFKSGEKYNKIFRSN